MSDVPNPRDFPAHITIRPEDFAAHCTQDELAVLQQRYANALQTISYWAEVATTGHRAIEVLQAEVRRLTRQMSEGVVAMSGTPIADTKSHVETLLDDLAKGRVSPSQMDTINEAIRRARADHALGQVTKR